MIKKLVILAGGLGTRLSEETETKPKPMVEIGGHPILWHIMKSYSAHGIHEFVLCLGYKGYLIKEYFANYHLHSSDVEFDLASNSMQVLEKRGEPWKVTLADTGVDTMTGGRLARIRRYVGNETFCMTYGDGLSDVDITRLIEFHKESGKDATVTAVRPPGRFGALEVAGEEVAAFAEKPIGDGNWINGGFFVLEPQVLERVESDETVWEQEPLEGLARDGQLACFCHEGFWQPMDTLRDKRQLEDLWTKRKAPWKSW